MLNRRTFLLGTTCVALAGCSTTQIEDAQARWNKFVDQVTAQVAVGCNLYNGYIPTVQTIANAVAAVYGPQTQLIVAGIIGSVNTVASTLCQAVANLPPNTLSARLRGSSPNHPKVINTIVVNGQNDTVTGYSVSRGMRRRTYKFHR